MNMESLKSLGGSVIMLIGMWLVGSGKVDQATWGTVSSALSNIGADLMVLGPVAYKLWKTTHTQLGNSAKVIPGVVLSVTNPAIAPATLVAQATDKNEPKVQMANTLEGGDR